MQLSAAAEQRLNEGEFPRRPGENGCQALARASSSLGVTGAHDGDDDSIIVRADCQNRRASRWANYQ